MFVNVRTAARLTGMTWATITAAIRQGSLPAFCQECQSRLPLDVLLHRALHECGMDRDYTQQHHVVVRLMQAKRYAANPMEKIT